MGGRFHIRTFGCQMNQHDAEKMANLLHHAGYRPAADADSADVVLIHTCSIREKAESKLYSELGSLLDSKRRRPGLIVGVAGCVAQQEGGRLLRRFPGLDFVFGPQNLAQLPELVAGARGRGRALRVDYDADPQARFDLPERHPEYASPTPGRAFVTVMEGCDLFCTYCIVPLTRGREVSRASSAILDEVRALAAHGVREITLLGQTVNAYGRPRPGMARDEIAFAELIRKVAGIPGIRRIRFTSPHPLFMGDDLIRCYAEVEALCPHVHLPLQSGSTRVLRAMNRRYTREDYAACVEALRRARPDIALTTDLIVGFPGETREDFEQTLSLVRELAFADSFSFKYSERPGTPAQRRALAPIEAGEAQARLAELQSLQGELTRRYQEARIGQRTPVLVEGLDRHGALRGRCPHNRIVNFRPASPPPLPGTLVDVALTAATPHSLLGEQVVSPPSSNASTLLPLV
jgi:tRNA-2-methylthio-N6-dimethylallyladenosine synthase